MLMRLDQREAAMGCFVQSVKERPYNWSCWSQLGQLVKSADVVGVFLLDHRCILMFGVLSSSSSLVPADPQFIDLKERLSPSPMLTFFAITVMLDLHTATDLVMNMIKELQAVFPDSVHLRAQRAMVFYHMRGGSCFITI